MKKLKLIILCSALILSNPAMATSGGKQVPPSALSFVEMVMSIFN